MRNRTWDFRSSRSDDLPPHWQCTVSRASNSITSFLLRLLIVISHSNLLCHQGFSHKCSELGLQETNFAENVFKLSSPSAPSQHRSLPPLEVGGGERLSTIPFLRKETEGREWKNNCLWWVDGPVGSWTEPKLNSEIMRLIRTICLLRSRLLSATQRCPAGGVALRDILKNGSKVRLMLR